MKRVLIFSDPHCGHQAGLTPPDSRFRVISNPETALESLQNRFVEVQTQVWQWFSKTVKALQPIDILFDMGDNLDGRGEKSGSTELITADQNKQCAMGVRAIREIKAKKNYMVYGSPYHATSGYSDWEDGIAKDIEAVEIASKLFIDVEGVIFDLRHKASKSSIPHGQGTLLAKQKLWNSMWAEVDMQPNADVVIRGHIHDYSFIGRQNWLAMSAPGLEWWTKFGDRICDGIINIGLVYFDIKSKNDFTWEHIGCNLGILKADLIKA